MKCPGLIEKIIFNNTIQEICPAGIKTHLQVLIIDLDMMKGKFYIRKYTQVPGSIGDVPYMHIPELHILINRDKNQLLRLDTISHTKKPGIR